MSELALVSSGKPRLQRWVDEGRRGSAAALALSENPANFLSTIQVGITVIGITSGAFGEATIAQPLATWLSKWPLTADHASLLATAAMVTVITAATLIIGELVPKRLALLNPEAIASVMSTPMSWLTIAAYPLVRLLSLTTGAVLHLIGIRPSAEPPVTEEEIQILMDHGTRAGVFEAHERKLVTRVFRLDGLRDQFDLAAVDLLEQIRYVDRDHVAVQGLHGGQAAGPTHGTLGKIGIAAAQLRQTANVGGCVVDGLRLHRVGGTCLILLCGRVPAVSLLCLVVASWLLLRRRILLARCAARHADRYWRGGAEVSGRCHTDVGAALQSKNSIRHAITTSLLRRLSRSLNHTSIDNAGA
jgi:hypothetical protein